MDQQLLEDTIHEMTCRDRYAKTSAQVGMHIRNVHDEISEAEVVAEMWGEHAPPDLEGMLSLAIGGRSDMVIAIPLCCDGKPQQSQCGQHSVQKTS